MDKKSYEALRAKGISANPNSFLIMLSTFQTTASLILAFQHHKALVGVHRFRFSVMVVITVNLEPMNPEPAKRRFLIVKRIPA